MAALTGDRDGGGSTIMERGGTRSVLGHLGLGVDLLDGGSIMERGRMRPMAGLGSANATAPGARAGFGAARPNAEQCETFCARTCMFIQ